VNPRIGPKGPPQDFGLVLRALAFGAEKHKKQRRKDVGALPYVNHLIAVADVLYNEGGIDDIEVLCAAVLHDTLEDTRTTTTEIRELFGDTICDMVMEVSDDRRLSRHERKRMQVDHAPSLSSGARLIKLADKICNLRDILNVPPIGWSRLRKREYFDWAKEVVDQIRGTHPELERVFDETYAKKPAPGWFGSSSP
jgi:GTP diphosphokinase / guanosine-3',5'-bis(diphosphate) 3'-diphosphatase